VAGEDLRGLCREVFGVPLTDVYSAQEVGYIALQCPDYPHYHIQAESLLVEILDEQNRPCGPGEVGRVVVTTLQNFGAPLIRYAIGDYAEVGEPCPCRRGLPVIRRIQGRVRNMVRLPDGRRHWPSFPTRGFAHIGAIRQLQLAQVAPAVIEARLVVGRPFDEAEAEVFTGFVRERLDYPFEVRLRYLDAIPRSKSGKFEDFVSEIS
jgi:phenylacetate-CoA ligase